MNAYFDYDVWNQNFSAEFLSAISSNFGTDVVNLSVIHMYHLDKLSLCCKPEISKGSIYDD